MWNPQIYVLKSGSRLKKFGNHCCTPINYVLRGRASLGPWSLRCTSFDLWNMRHSLRHVIKHVTRQRPLWRHLDRFVLVNFQLTSSARSYVTVVISAREHVIVEAVESVWERSGKHRRDGLINGLPLFDHNKDFLPVASHSNAVEWIGALLAVIVTVGSNRTMAAVVLGEKCTWQFLLLGSTACGRNVLRQQYWQLRRWSQQRYSCWIGKEWTNCNAPNNSTPLGSGLLMSDLSANRIEMCARSICARNVYKYECFQNQTEHIFKSIFSYAVHNKRGLSTCK